MIRINRYIEVVTYGFVDDLGNWKDAQPPAVNDPKSKIINTVSNEVMKPRDGTLI